MVFWLLAATMLGLAIAAVLLPLAWRGGAVRDAAPDIAVYRDQLAEIERDVSSGRMALDEAEPARIEVKRRILAAAPEPGQAADPAGGDFRRRAAAVIGLILVPAIAIGGYLGLGSPDMPAQPLASRAAPAPDAQNLPAMVAAVEKHLREKPDDGRGWEIVAPALVNLGRLDDAANAFRNAIKLNGPSADRYAALGEVIVAKADGVITAEARAVFESGLAADPKAARPRYYLAIAAEQDGDRAAAITKLKAIVADAPPGAPWVPFINGELNRLGDSSSTVAPAPAGDDTARQIASLPEADRMQMIRGMVERLADKLHADGNDPEGWQKLVRSYTVLGDKDRARAAVAEALAALKGNDAARAAIETLARDLGLNS